MLILPENLWIYFQDSSILSEKQATKVPPMWFYRTKAELSFNNQQDPCEDSCAIHRWVLHSFSAL